VSPPAGEPASYEGLYKGFDATARSPGLARPAGNPAVTETMPERPQTASKYAPSTTSPKREALAADTPEAPVHMVPTDAGRWFGRQVRA
jgi:hypothetical protein